MSTLDYAYRARNITNSNRPKINQMLSKREVFKGYSDEMDRLRRELLTCRVKNWVNLAKENYHEQLVASLKLNMMKFWMIWSIVWQCCRGEGESFYGG